jgi:soluble lytic murein transglycosylase-like protein
MAATVQAQITSTANQYGVDPSLALQVATVESGLDNNAVSSAGAIGIFQLMPATAAGLGVNPHDPVQNINGGVRYLAQLLSRYGSDASKALAAFNWGPTNLDRAIAQYGVNWIAALPDETLNYLAKILGAAPSAPLLAPAANMPAVDPSTLIDPSSVGLPAAAGGDSSTTTMLLLGAIGLFFIWAFEEAWN